MAAKIEEETTPSSEHNLICPLCLDIFDEPTLLTSCEHTFCKKCLKRYDLSHQDLDHMVCPLCRKITKLSTNRVDDLPNNVKVNELVDDYHAKCGGVNAVLEKRPKCTSCNSHKDAVSFCRTCQNYMCSDCDASHKQLVRVFEGHEIVSIEDIIEGNVIICHPCERCSIHKQENKDMFCEGCKIHVCLKCVILSHRDHKIKSHEDFEMELQAEVNDLVQRCAAKKSELEKNIQNMEAQRDELNDLVQRCATKKSELEKNIQNMETQRVELRIAIQKLRQDVSQAYSVKAKQLEEKQRTLNDQIDALEHSFDEDLDVLKSKDRQKIKSICSSMSLVANDKLGRLETESLSAHILLCEELKDMLKEATDYTSAAAITKKAQQKKFKPADNTRLDLGKITEQDLEPAQGAKLKEATESDHNSAAVKREKTQKKPADDTRLDLGSISSDPKLQVIHCVALKRGMWGMTKYSDDSVAIGYGGNAQGIDIIDYAGNQQRYMHIPSDMKCYDLVFQQDRSLCVSTGSTKEAYLYSSNGSKKSTSIQVTRTGYYPRLNRSPSDEIIVANKGNEVYIYDPTGTTLKHTVPHQSTMQASATKADLIITSSCCLKPSIVTVYDRNGNAGKLLRAPKDVCLYAAVDEQDRVYVASVDCKNSKVVIRLYDINGLNLKERAEFNALHLSLEGWCYLVSLSPDLLAFACDDKLYFIKIYHCNSKVSL